MNQVSIHCAILFHIATVRTLDSVVPSDRMVTLPQPGQTAVMHGMMRLSMDSIVPSTFPSHTSAEA